MTLRFFRRKSGAAKTAPEEPAPEEQRPAPQPSARPARRRRGGAGSSSRSGGTAEAATEKQESAPTAKPSSGRSRRGRRGGTARKAEAPAVAPAPAPAPAAAPVIPLRGEPGTLEALLAQQQAAVSQIADQQLTVLKGLQGSLSAIENRLAGREHLAPGADRPRIGIFVDVPNVMYAAERLRVTLDFKKMLDFIVHGRELVRASAYAPISDDPEERLETQKFVQPFVDLGYRIVTKPLKRYADGSIKANFDVELAIDVVTMSDRLDIVVLVSGDGDFRRLVEIVESKGVRVEVVAFGQSTAAELRAVADVYIDLKDHLPELRAK